MLGSQRQEHLYEPNPAFWLPLEPEAAVVSAEAYAPFPFTLARLWRDLMEGRWRVRRTWCCPVRCHAELVPSPDRSRPILERERKFIERALVGDFEKCIALDAGVSISTVAGQIARVMQGWGLPGGVSYFPPLLTIAAHAHLGRTRNLLGLAFAADAGSSLLVSAGRPDNILPTSLSASERSIVNRLVEGCTRDQIARERGRSSRTVANQMAAIFAKLGTPGRRTLISKLIEDWSDGALSFVST